MGVEVYEFSGNDIGKLRENYERDSHLEDLLPEYTFNEKGNLTSSNGYLQFVETGDEKFICFNLQPCDSLLGEEISQCGLEELIKGNDIRPYIDKMRKLNVEQFGRSYNRLEYLIVALTYTASYYVGGGYTDNELDVEVVGALIGNKLERIELEPCQK